MSPLSQWAERIPVDCNYGDADAYWVILQWVYFCGLSTCLQDTQSTVSSLEVSQCYSFVQLAPGLNYLQDVVVDSFPFQQCSQGFFFGY